MRQIGNLQTQFKDPAFRACHSYGGTLRKDKKNRCARPLATRQPIHLVIRSTKAVGMLSLLKKANIKIISETLKKLAPLYGITIYEFANGGNHLHLLIKLANRFAYAAFIRRFTGEVALKIKLQAESTNGTLASREMQKDEIERAFKDGFWDFRPFTRIVRGWRGFLICRDYVWLNRLEAIGVIPYSPERLKWAKSGQDPGWLKRVTT